MSESEIWRLKVAVRPDSPTRLCGTNASDRAVIWDFLDPYQEPRRKVYSLNRPPPGTSNNA